MIFFLTNRIIVHKKKARKQCLLKWSYTKTNCYSRRREVEKRLPLLTKTLYVIQMFITSFFLKQQVIQIRMAKPFNCLLILAWLLIPSGCVQPCINEKGQYVKTPHLFKEVRIGYLINFKKINSLSQALNCLCNYLLCLTVYQVLQNCKTL